MDNSAASQARAAGRGLAGHVRLVTAGCALLVLLGVAQQAPYTAAGVVDTERPSKEAPHAYFEALSARPERRGAYSLRDQAQLNGFVKDTTSTFWTYNPGGDTHPLRQDAAKLFKPPRVAFDRYPQFASYGTSGDEGIPGNQRLRIPLGISSGSLVLVWDFWWGGEFQTNRGSVDAFKTFAVMQGRAVDSTDPYWVLKDGLLSIGPDGATNHYDTIDYPHSALDPDAPGVLNDDPFRPTGLGAAPSRGFVTRRNVWSRYWLEVRLRVPGSEFTEWSKTALGGAPLSGVWDMASLWVADEQEDARRVIYRVPISPTDSSVMLSHFRIQFDTSTHNENGTSGLTGPYVAYARNVVVLQNAVVQESDPAGASWTSGEKPSAPRNVRIVRP
jgi:hypothetical protein